MARTTASKTDILGDAGYAYDFDHEMYINRKAKKAFSVEYIADHADGEIYERMAERTDGREWTFYFNSPPSETVKHELECALG
jgi:hypothetical protein